MPGASYIPKVLQEGSSHTLPDVLMLDNPDVQQIASTGALTPLSQYGLSASGSVRRRCRGVDLPGSAVRAAAGREHDRPVLQQGRAQQGWRDAAHDVGGAADRCQEAHLGQPVRHRLRRASATGEATWTFLPFMWSNGGDEKDIATQQTADALQQWVDLVKDGAASKSVLTWTQGDVLDQFKAGKAAMMINGPWQLPALNAVKGLNYGVVPIPAPAAGKPTIGPLGGETWTVPNTGNTDREAGRRQDRRVLVLRPEPTVAGITAPDGTHQDRAPGAVHRGKSRDDDLQRPRHRSPVSHR